MISLFKGWAILGIATSSAIFFSSQQHPLFWGVITGGCLAVYYALDSYQNE